MKRNWIAVSAMTIAIRTTDCAAELAEIEADEPVVIDLVDEDLGRLVGAALGHVAR